MQEIFLAAREGRGDLLIVNQDFQQAVKFSSERDFDLVEDSTEVDVVDDIVTSIAWDVISKNGRVVFTNQSELDELGSITLLARY